MRPTIQISDAEARQYDLEPEPISPGDVLAGAPEARSVKLTESGNGRVSSHIWDCTAGSFRWHCHCDEVIHIVEGEAHVRDDAGNSLVFSAGDVVQFRLGSSALWTVPRYIRKVAFLSHPPRAVRIARRIARIPSKLRRVVLGEGPAPQPPVPAISVSLPPADRGVTDEWNSGAALPPWPTDGTFSDTRSTSDGRTVS
jgi:uncharacterized cupin superfamily protein